MGIEIGAAGEALTAIVITNELANSSAPPDVVPHNSDINHCANCGAQLNGKYCHVCGQSSHIHRSLFHMFEEVLHGVFHFDTKAWHTIPALIFRPGHLTRDYIEGKRSYYVSPLALFLFLIFLMFFVFSFTMKGPGNEILNAPESREEVVKELSNLQTSIADKTAEKAKLKPYDSDIWQLENEINETRLEFKKLQDALDKLDGKALNVIEVEQQLALAEKKLKEQRAIETAQKNTSSPNPSSSSMPAENLIKPWELAQQIRFTEREIKYYKKRLANNKEKDEIKQERKASDKSQTSATPTENTNPSDTNITNDINIQYNDLSEIPYVGEALAHANKNRELTLYKMKQKASSLAFLLMPISLPFLWLLFAFKRKYVMFDHAVFSLYSLSFMCLLMMLVAILSKFDLTGTAGVLFMLVPPIHMFVQLRHAYRLGVFGTLWRTLALLCIAFISLTLYALVVTMLSA